MLNYRVIRKRLEKIAKVVNPAKYQMTVQEQERLREILSLTIPFEHPEYPRSDYMRIVNKVITPEQHARATVEAWKVKNKSIAAGGDYK